MAEPAPRSVRPAGAEDAPHLARLLHAFNAEFDEPTPPVATLAERCRRLLGAGEITVLLAGEGPDGFVQLRLRPSVWMEGPDVYVEELYVVPQRRGHGIGRALLEAAMQVAREAGAGHIDLTTGEDDVVARELYESSGFTNREGGEGGPRMLYYEREL